ncbi:MAG: hypothetical protein CBD31_02090 [Flavobacteriaceae bacterium TMED171]|nr:hypothetical protein [Flavobacteriaceae bacterium]OUW32296.1 MAG: hypothetical protein CBD31_02090 [Flavobacteriaceae bacterium TMED171]|tara:strand:+ start:11 stop:880 length:870 start_codon:yes stop_codon:yes gene_type:complete
MIKLNRIKWALRKLSLPVKSKEIVLDIGSGGYPYPRADFLVDRISGAEHRNNFSLITDRIIILSDARKLPFKDKSIDFSIASHVLEHISNPEIFIKELMRVSKRGYIEVPSALFERIFPYNIHCLEIDVLDDELIIHKKSKPIIDDFMHSFSYLDKNGRLGKIMYENPKSFHVRLYWEDKIKFKIINDEVDCSWVESIYFQENSDSIGTNKLVNNLTWRNLGFYLATNYYKLTRKKFRNDSVIKKILCCPDCHNEFIYKRSFFYCPNCNYDFIKEKKVYNFESKPHYNN